MSKIIAEYAHYFLIFAYIIYCFIDEKYRAFMLSEKFYKSAFVALPIGFLVGFCMFWGFVGLVPFSLIFIFLSIAIPLVILLAIIQARFKKLAILLGLLIAFCIFYWQEILFYFLINMFVPMIILLIIPFILVRFILKKITKSNQAIINTEKYRAINFICIFLISASFSLSALGVYGFFYYENNKWLFIRIFNSIIGYF